MPYIALFMPYIIPYIASCSELLCGSCHAMCDVVNYVVPCWVYRTSCSEWLCRSCHALCHELYHVLCHKLCHKLCSELCSESHRVSCSDSVIQVESNDTSPRTLSLNPRTVMNEVIQGSSPMGYLVQPNCKQLLSIRCHLYYEWNSILIIRHLFALYSLQFLSSIPPNPHKNQIRHHIILSMSICDHCSCSAQLSSAQLVAISMLNRQILRLPNLQYLMQLGVFFILRVSSYLCLPPNLAAASLVHSRHSIMPQ